MLLSFFIGSGNQSMQVYQNNIVDFRKKMLTLQRQLNDLN